MILPKSFYNRSALKVAQELLGCFLVRKLDPSRKKGTRYPIGYRVPLRRFKIVETEAYNGPNDLASHASRGRTKRNEVMFGPAGIIYVYFTYGLHYMLNIVTGRINYPAAVLIRGIEPVGAIPSQQAGRYELPLRVNGPARLTKTLGIEKSLNGLPIYIKKHKLWIEGRKKEIKPAEIKKTTRIGVDYAGKYRNKKWRFYLKDSQFISRK